MTVTDFIRPSRNKGEWTQAQIKSVTVTDCANAMWKWLRAKRRARILARRPIADALWRDVVESTPYLRVLGEAERAQLRKLATWFVAEKTFVGTHELEVDDYMRVTVAAQACLPILELGIDWYRDWLTVVMYPGGFVAHREVEDEDGIVHTGFEELDGESMAGGPMAISWQETDPRTAPDEPVVVLHECAHKLDELTGEPNGLPPLHAGMPRREWSAAFSDAYERFAAEADEGTDALAFDDYAATDAAEFFAVMTEAFFTAPADLADGYPCVYDQLRAFYRQDPLARR